MRAAIAARGGEKLADLCAVTCAQAFACDAVEPDQVSRLFDDEEKPIGTPDVVVFYASARARGPLVELVPADVENARAVSALAGLLVAQEEVRRMLPRKSGAILFTGASASVEGYAQSPRFAVGKFALSGLAQSMARARAARHPRRAFCDRRRIRNPGRT